MVEVNVYYFQSRATRSTVHKHPITQTANTISNTRQLQRTSNNSTLIERKQKQPSERKRHTQKQQHKNHIRLIRI